MSPEHGKFILKPSPKVQEICLEYICLNPAVIMNRITDEASKVILASGTLEPAGDFQLLEGQKHKFSCGHIIKPE